MSGEYPENWDLIASTVKQAAHWRCVRCDHPNEPAKGRTLTVHHLDRDKSNCEPWNLAALCQRCHLQIQAKVDMNQTYMFGHADWMKPYAEGRQAAMAAAEQERRDK